MTDDLKNDVRTLAGLLFTADEVINMLHLDEAETLSLRKGELQTHYQQGFYEAEIALRSAIKKLAIAGSSPAQTLLVRLTERHQAQQFMNDL